MSINHSKYHPQFTWSKMIYISCFLHLFLKAATNAITIKPWFDRPSLRLAISEKATLQCCYTYHTILKPIWIQNVMITPNYSIPIPVDREIVKVTNGIRSDLTCSSLMLSSITLNDTGLYQCFLLDPKTNASVYTPGTFLQVYGE